MAEATTARLGYTVKGIETIAGGSGVRAASIRLRRATSSSGTFTATLATSTFCLAGILRIETRAPARRRADLGGRYAIPPKAAHRVPNGGSDDCRFMQLQGVGTYDFQKVQD